MPVTIGRKWQNLFFFFNVMLDWNNYRFRILNYFHCFPNFPSLPIKADKIGYKGNSIKALGRLSQTITLLRSVLKQRHYRVFVQSLDVLLWSYGISFCPPWVIRYAQLLHSVGNPGQSLPHPYAAWILVSVRIDKLLHYFLGFCHSVKRNVFSA